MYIFFKVLKYMDNKLRNYDFVQENIRNTYKKMIKYQNVKYVLSMKQKYKTFPNIKMSIWDVIDKLNYIVDESDPDSDHPQIVHACQTSAFLDCVYLEPNTNKLKEMIKIKDLFSKGEWEFLPYVVKNKYVKSCYLHNLYSHIEEWDWLPLIGFIHDLGKVMVIPEFGGLEQWSVVGDTFPVGCIYTNKNVFHKEKFHRSNTDYALYKTFTGRYKEKCGFDSVDFCYGHDEYLSNVLKKNNTKLPDEALYLIRYHSFYAWHNPRNSNIRGYTYLADEYDWLMLPLLKAFQKADLYSKVEDIPNIDKVKEVFNPLVKKYIGKEEIIW